MTISPIRWLGTSRSMRSATLSSTRCAIRSRSSVETGRFWHAVISPIRILRRSNSSRLPSRLTTRSGVSSMRSRVVNRRSQPVHSRRRRMTKPSALSRESITLSSFFLQKGQRMSRLRHRSVRPPRNGSTQLSGGNNPRM
jgi:hypothetical protein